MRHNGYVLFIMLVVLLFVAAVLFHLQQDNYLAQLSQRHLEKLSQERSAVNNVFFTLNHASQKNLACFSVSDDQLSLKNFWNSRQACRLYWRGVKVNYALREYQKEQQDPGYLEYSLRAQTVVSEVWLRVVVDEATAKIVSWAYFIQK